MKVAQLLPELNFGGVERGTIDLANFLVSQGHDAVVISAGGVLENELDTEVKSLQIPISKKSFSALMQFKALKEIILNCGGIPIECKTGHSIIKNKII